MPSLKYIDENGQVVFIVRGRRGERGETGSQGILGEAGYTPVKGVDYFTDEDKAEFEGYLAAELAKRGQLAPEYADSIAECTDTSKLYVLPDGYIYAYTLGEAVPTYTNVLETGTVELNNRYNSSNALTAADGYIALDYVAAAQGDVLRFKPSTLVTEVGTSAYCRLRCYNSGGTLLGNTDKETKAEYTITIDDNDVASITIPYANTAKIRANLSVSTSAITSLDTDAFIMTVNEEISAGGTGYGWRSTGHAFVPADYEERIISLEDEAAEKSREDASRDDRISALEDGLSAVAERGTDGAFSLGEIFAPSPQKPADSSEEADFDAEVCKSADIFAAFDALCERYPSYITGELMGKDESGVYDIKRYVLSKRYYNAWCKRGYPRMYAWVNGSAVIYSESVSPRIGDTLYSTAYIGTAYGTVTAVDTPNQTRTVGGLAFTHDPSRDVEPALVYTTVLRAAANAVDNGLYNVNKARVGTLSSVSGAVLTDSAGVLYDRYPLGDRNRSMDAPIVVTIGANEHGPDPDPRLCAIICARLAADLCECKHTDNGMLRYLKSNVMLVMLPVINPYGFDLGESSPKGTGYYNYNGVNINRNYDCPGFGLETNAGPCGDYGGSENETQYFMNTLAEPKSAVGISLHALGHRTEGEFNGASNSLCHYQGNGFNAEKIRKIAEVMKCCYNSDFTSYNTAPLETTAKSPTYITKVGARGGIIEMQPMEGDTLNFLTSWAMEANYTLLLECICMWLGDSLGI